MEYLRFAEEIVLLLLHDGRGKFAHVPDWSSRYAFGGSVLMDLALENRIDTDLEKLVLVDASPTGDSLLDPMLAEIAAEEEPRGPRFWVERAGSREEEIREGRCNGWSSVTFSSTTRIVSCGYSIPSGTRYSTTRPPGR